MMFDTHPLANIPVCGRCRKLESNCECTEKEIVRKVTLIGKGAYGEVFRFDLVDGGEVAVKRINGINILHEIDQRQVLEEIRIHKWLHSLKHDNIVKLYKCEAIWRQNTVESVCLYMENMSGTMQSMLQATRDMGEGVKLDLTEQLLCGLQCMHDHGILHRDIKPSNILVSEDLKILKLADFGLAAAANTRVKTHYVITRWYRPPELLMSTPYYGTPVDVWSCACVLHELHSIRMPPKVLFPGKTSQHQLELIVHGMGDSESNKLALNKLFIHMTDPCMGKVIKVPSCTKGGMTQTLQIAGCATEVAHILAEALSIDPGSRPSASELRKQFRLLHVQTSHDNLGSNVDTMSPGGTLENESDFGLFYPGGEIIVGSDCIMRTIGSEDFDDWRRLPRSPAAMSYSSNIDITDGFV